MFSTGMFNGLKKIVGKGVDDVSNINHQQLPAHPEQSTVPLPKFNKKRKVAERTDAQNIKKKYEISCCPGIVFYATFFFFHTPCFVQNNIGKKYT